MKKLFDGTNTTPARAYASIDEEMTAEELEKLKKKIARAERRIR